MADVGAVAADHMAQLDALLPEVARADLWRLGGAMLADDVPGMRLHCDRLFDSTGATGRWLLDRMDQPYDRLLLDLHWAILDLQYPTADRYAAPRGAA